MFKYFRKAISIAIIIAFSFNPACWQVGVIPFSLPEVYAGEMVIPVMPAPGMRMGLSSAFTPANLKGITIHPDNALKFDFLIYKGDGNLDDSQKKQEYNKLIKYFLASLTIPDEDQWVNLSPYEKGRIIQTNFGRTEMGRDLLSQDYLLKQITSSLMYPESGFGKVFWDKVYQRAYKEYGMTNIPVNTFNKVWIVPDEAIVYESGNTAYVLKSHLKVMLEEDYLALSRQSSKLEDGSWKEKTTPSSFEPRASSSKLGSQIIREIILPEIEREVNEGKNFAMLRQIYSGMILATWYKKALKESLLGKVYADKAKVKGVDQDPIANEEIYQKYLAAFKKGVYNYIKEDFDQYTKQIIPRKYFAGGIMNRVDHAMTVMTFRTIIAIPSFLRGMAGSLKVKMTDRVVVILAEKKAMTRVVQVLSSGVPLSLSLPATAEAGSVPNIVFTYPNVAIVIGVAVAGLLINYFLNTHTLKGILSSYDGHGRNADVVQLKFKLAARLKGKSSKWLADLLQNYESSYVREQAALELASRGDRRAIDQLKKMLEVTYGEQWWKVSELLKTVGASKEEMFEAYDHVASYASFPDARLEAIKVLVQKYDKDRVINTLSKILLHEKQQTYNNHNPRILNFLTKEIEKLRKERDTLFEDRAQLDVPGGIDFNSSSFNLYIKRDGRGVPFVQQDMAQLGRIEGFEPNIIEIKAVTFLPILSELRQKLQ